MLNKQFLFMKFIREILSAVESTTTQSLRVTLTRQLAEVLIRGISGAEYKPPEVLSDSIGNIINKTTFIVIKFKTRLKLEIKSLL